MKKSKLLSIFLVFCVIISLLSGLNLTIEAAEISKENLVLDKAAVPSLLSYEKAVSQGHVLRLREEEELHTIVFLNKDGTKSMYMFDENIKYLDSNNVVKEKTNKLKLNNDGSVTNIANEINLQFPKDIQSGVTIKYGDYKIQMTPETSYKSLSSSVDFNKKEDSSESDSVLYKNVFGQGIGLYYQPTFSGLKEDIILDSYTGVNEFSFLLSTNGLKIDITNEKPVLFDPNKKEFQIGIGNIDIFDSIGTYAIGSIKVEEVESEQRYRLSIVVPEEYLKNPDIVYPVNIDPTLSILGNTNIIDDATIYTNHQENFGTAHSMFVGNFNVWYPTSPQQRGIARSLVKFPGLITNGTFNLEYLKGNIISVKYNFSDIDRDSGPNKIYAYLAKTDWVENQVVKNDANWDPYNIFIGQTTIVPTDPNQYPFPRYEIDITKAVDLWKQGIYNHYGILLKSTNENLEAVVLGASESGEPVGRLDSKPYIYVHYTANNSGLIYKIKNVFSEKYLNVANGYDTNKMNVYQYVNEDSRLAQTFRLVYDSTNAAYRIYAMCSMNGRRKVLDVVKSASGVAGLTSGCNVQIYNPVDNIAELFIIEDVGYYQYVFKLKYNTNLALTAYGWGDGSAGGTSPTSPGNVFVSTYTGASNQKWKLERYDVNHDNYYENMNVQYPFQSSSPPKKISSSYGYRNLGTDALHGGIDIPASGGTNLYSVFKGKVITIGSNDTRGNYIIIEAMEDEYSVYNQYENAPKLRIIYMHLQESPTVTNPAVVKGATVTTSMLVGKVGTTGASTGNHLHFSFITDGGTDASTISKTINPMISYPNMNFTY